MTKLYINYHHVRPNFESLYTSALGHICGYDMSVVHVSFAIKRDGCEYMEQYDYTQAGITSYNTLDFPSDVVEYHVKEISDSQLSAIYRRICEMQELNTKISIFEGLHILLERQPRNLVCTTFTNYILFANRGEWVPSKMREHYRKSTTIDYQFIISEETLWARISGCVKNHARLVAQKTTLMCGTLPICKGRFGTVIQRVVRIISQSTILLGKKE